MLEQKTKIKINVERNIITLNEQHTVNEPKILKKR